MTNFTIVSNEIFNLDLTSGAFKLYTALLSYCYNDSNSCFPSQQTLGEKIGKSVRTIQRYLNELVEKGLVSVKRRGSTSNLYILLKKTVKNAEHTCKKLKKQIHHMKSPSKNSFIINSNKHSASKNSYSTTGTERKYDCNKLEALLLGNAPELTYADCIIED